MIFVYIMKARVCVCLERQKVGSKRGSKGRAMCQWLGDLNGVEAETNCAAKIFQYRTAHANKPSGEIQGGGGRWEVVRSFDFFFFLWSLGARKKTKKKHEFIVC